MNLALVLMGKSILERTQLISEWATSSSASLRLAIAQVLATPLAALGVASAIEYLAQDADASVRGAAVKAAAQRRQDDPGFYSALLGRLARDSDSAVRRIAQRLLRS